MHESHKACINGDLETIIRIVHMNLPIPFCLELAHEPFIGLDMMMLIAAQFGQVAIVHYLVQAGADIHIRNEWALRLAVAHGHLQTVKYLVEQGADLCILGNEALRISSYYGQLPLVKYLLEHGADLNAIEGRPLKIALQENHSHIVKYLIDHGATPHTFNTWIQLKLHNLQHAHWM